VLAAAGSGKPEVSLASSLTVKLTSNAPAFSMIKLIVLVSPKMMLNDTFGLTAFSTARLRRQRTGTEKGPVSARNGIDAVMSDDGGEGGWG
jgi:hypothetical protein